MLLVDVNVLIYACRQDFKDHARYASWLQDLIYGNEAYGTSDLVLSGFLRIVTNRRVFREPSTMEEALSFVQAVRNQPQCVNIAPGPRHWSIFCDLCRNAGVKGTLVPDAYFAALAIESGCEWITLDHGYSRFPGLRWRRPLG
jgi:uncharacterized protein